MNIINTILKVLTIILLLLLFSCSLEKRLNYHTNSIDKILSKDQSLKSKFDTTIIKVKDSVNIVFDIKDSLKLTYDTITFQNNLDSLLLLEELSKLVTDKERLININNERQRLINQLKLSVYKDSLYDFPLKLQIENKGQLEIYNYNLTLLYEKGKIKLLSDNIKFNIDTITNNVILNYKKDFTFKTWIKDTRTLFLFFIVLILMFLLVAILKSK